MYVNSLHENKYQSSSSSSRNEYHQILMERRRTLNPTECRHAFPHISFRESRTERLLLW